MVIEQDRIVRLFKVAGNGLIDRSFVRSFRKKGISILDVPREEEVREENFSLLIRIKVVVCMVCVQRDFSFLFDNNL